jgi:predicted phage terminase large subunit-like protein
MKKKKLQPKKRNVNKIYPTFTDYFLFHGEAEKEPRENREFHIEIDRLFELLLLGKLPDGKKNLMLLMPPRYGKTFKARDFVGYGLGIFPDSEYIYTSYSGTMAVAQTAKIKTDVQKEWYQKIFDVRLEKEGEAYFTTRQGGAVFGVGVGGSITGFGAGKKRPEWGGCIVIDDPMKADDARSAATKEHVRQWYTGVLKSRTNSKHTPIVMIMQRLDPNDLAGFILETEAEDWYVLKIKGLGEDGKSVWEMVKSTEELLKLKEVDEFTFFSQYQQDPQKEGGNIIKKHWWKYYDCVNQDYKVDGLVFLTADTAMKTKNMNDYSVLCAWHATGTHLDLLGEYRAKMEFPELLRQAKRFWVEWGKWGAKTFYIEDKVSGTSLGQTMAEQGIPVILWKPQDYDFPDDKVGRVKHSTFYVEAGRVRMPLHNPDLASAFIEECAAFAGEDEINDRVDNLTMATSIWKYKGGGYDVKAA